MNKLIFLILIISKINSYAQDYAVKDILETLSKATKEHENINIEFELTIENKSQNIDEKQKGILVLEGNKFRLEIDNQHIINDGKTQWIHLTDVNEVQILKYDKNNDFLSPNKLLTIYEDGFKYNFIGTEYIKGASLQIIDLIPEERESIIKLRIVVNSTKMQLEKMTIYDKNGGTYKYEIKSFRTNSVIKPFTFNRVDFPDVNVIDLR